ncbi:hypothetical protein SD78_0360 [Bacillus badius]|nr:hypothetical protein SD78_0360 [Bacillus badius]
MCPKGLSEPARKKRERSQEEFQENVPFKETVSSDKWIKMKV